MKHAGINYSRASGDGPKTSRASALLRQLVRSKRARTTARLALLVAALVSLVGVPAPAENTSFLVIVNSENPTQAIGTDALSRIFMKKTKAWEDGNSILPVDLGGSSDTRKDFSRSVHGRSATAIKNHWQRRVFSGRGTPPPELESEDAVVMYVRYKRGAIGYVSTGTDLTGVHALKLQP